MIKDFNRKDLNIHDVVIRNLESESLNLSLNEIIMKILKMDMTMNTVLISANEYITKIFKMVNTFDANGFCAFVPNPPHSTIIPWTIADTF